MNAKYKVLNTRDVKELLKKLEDAYGFTSKLDYAFLEDSKHNLFVIHRDVELVDYGLIHVNSMGLYFGETNKYKEFRLSLEGSQIIGPHASKNVLDLNDEQARAYFLGGDVQIEHPNTVFVLLRHRGDYMGAAKVKDGKLLNYLPKVHRTKELLL